VIAHPTLKDTPTAAELATIFTTRKQNWSDGSRVVPLNLPTEHEARVIFDDAVLHMDAEEVARYWVDRRIRGGNPPPKQAPHPSAVIKLVEKTPGAIAYVPRAALGGQVKVVMEL
jgi:hypothetical protein